jgi:hypothetical protein
MRGLITDEEFVRHRPQSLISERYCTSRSALSSTWSTRFQRLSLFSVGLILLFCLFHFATSSP